jgi:type II secretory pathway pseudopilin PulG
MRRAWRGSADERWQVSEGSGVVHGEVPATRREGRDHRESGFTLAVLVMTLAVMAIMMTVAVQDAHFSQQREKEAELIFRGQQYAEGIRLFRLKYGRYPMRLKELWEAKPRVLRKKWKDPITDSYDWGLVFLGQGGQRLAGGATGRQATPTPQPATGGAEGSGEPGGFGTTSGEKVGPIIGVYSTSCDQSIKVYEGHTQYCKWKFTFQEQQAGRGNSQSPRPPRPTPTSKYPFGIPPLPETTPTPGG